MLNIQEAIRSLIQEELNKNTQGLDFEVSLYNVKHNELLENTLPVGDTYAVQQKRFIPVLIEEISGEYADLKNLTASEVFINLSFLIPVDTTDFNNMVIDETYEKVALALDDLRIRTNARKRPLGTPIVQKSEDYRLTILNETNLLSTDFQRYNFRLLENFDGIILTDGDSFNIRKIGSKIRVTKNSQSIEHPFKENEDYQITINKTSSSELDVSITGFGSTTNESLEGVDTTFKDITVGGLLMTFDRIRIGSSSGSLSLDLSDFADYIPDIGEKTDLDLSGTQTAYTTGTIGNIVLGYSIPNPTSNQFTMGNGLNYQQFELNMTGFVTDSVFVGNEVQYFIDGIEVFPFYRDESFVSETDPSQVVGSQITKHTAVQSILGREYSIYYKNETKLTNLAKKITSQEPNPNEVFTFKVVYPFFERQYKVIITQGSLGISNNQPISISLKFDLASDIIVPPTPSPTPTSTPTPTPTLTPTITPTPTPTSTPSTDFILNSVSKSKSTIEITTIVTPSLTLVSLSKSKSLLFLPDPTPT
jgi:hypothetical protein